MACSKPFVGQHFTSAIEFDDFVKAYAKSVKANFQIYDSKTIESCRLVEETKRKIENKDKLYYYRVQYNCYFGQQHCQSRGKNVRQSSTHKIGCPATILALLSKDRKTLVITKVNLVHDKHDDSKKSYGNLTPNRKLTPETKKHVTSLMVDYKASKKCIQEKVKSEKGIILTKKDLWNIELAARAAMNNKDVLNIIKENGGKLTLLKDGDKVNGIYFSTPGMQRNLLAWPEIIFIDGTYKLTDRNLTLMLIVVHDSNGKTEVAATCLLASENENSMRWFMETFKFENEEACAKIKTAMTDKDMTERKIIKEVFPEIVLKLCTFHVLKAFSREVKAMKCCSSEEKDRSCELFEELVNSESFARYEERYGKFCKEVPETVRAYFDKNWKPYVEEWSHYVITPETFSHRTNNVLESLNGKLKDDVGVNKPLHSFFKEFFAFLQSRELEIDKVASDMLNKRLILNVSADDPLKKYSDILTGYAFKKVKVGLETFRNINLQRQSSGEFIVPSKHCTFYPDIENCNCSTRVSLGFPCCHVFAVRQECNVDLFEPKLCLPRWTRAYYKIHQRIFRVPENEPDETLESNLHDTELEAVASLEQLNLDSLPEKRHVAGRPSSAFQCTVKIPKRKKTVYSEKTDSDKARTLLLWLNLSKPLIERTLKNEMFIRRQNLSNLETDSLPQSFKDEQVSIEVVKQFFDAEAFELLSLKVGELKSTNIYYCDRCKKEVSDPRFLKCDVCLRRFHVICCNYKRRPPANKPWFCPTCK